MIYLGQLPVILKQLPALEEKGTRPKQFGTVLAYARILLLLY